MTCLTPALVSVVGEEGDKRYLHPGEGSAFSEAVYHNLLRKYAARHSHVLDSSAPLTLTWDADYLARNPYGGQKKIGFKGIDMIGVQALCTISRDSALLELANDADIGELNSSGFGMIKMAKDRG